MGVPGVIVAFFASATAEPLSCPTAVVGGGWAGIYAAWRLVVDAKLLDPVELCLFEGRKAVGGRTYSVDVSNDERIKLVVDVGAYRFGRKQHLPADLIVNRLKLPTVCYQPDCLPDAEFNQTLYRVVDAQGRNAGYNTPIKVMLSELEAAGVRVYYQYVLTGVYAGVGSPSSSTLHFAGGAIATASSVLLNLPRVAVARLDPASVLFSADHSSLGYRMLRNCTPCADPAHGQAARPLLAVKVYAVYADPWWLTKLGLSEGSFVSVDASPSLVGRYHDGPVHRSGGGAGARVGPGALEAVYSYSVLQPAIGWYVPFAADVAEEPLTRTTDPALLGPLHERLMAYHAPAFAARGLNASATPPPEEVVLGVWTTDPLARLPDPMSANMHEMVGGAGCPAEPCLAGVTPREYNAAVGTPNAAHPAVHVANNDYAWTGEQGVPCCWAEQSLKSVERTLHRAWRLPPPVWLDADYYQRLLDA